MVGCEGKVGLLVVKLLRNSWVFAWLVVCLFGCLVGWFVVWLVGSCFACLVGWLFW